MKEVTASGQTVEEAVQSALEQLNATKDQVDVHIIDEGKKGFLGIFGSTRAIVSVKLKKNHIEEAEQFIEKVTKQMNLDIDIETVVNDQQVTFNLSGEKIALLIGKRGQTLNALQYLVHLVINTDSETYYRVILDAEGYRRRRNQTLESLALKMADKAVHLNRKVTLEPMPAFERKVIHQTLQTKNSVSTTSEGQEPFRYVVIIPKDS